MNIKLKRLFMIQVKTILTFAIVVALFSSALPAKAANGITSSDVRFGLNKGKQVTVKAYVSGVGLRDINVKLTKYSVKNERIKVNGKYINTKRVRATIVYNQNPLSDEEMQKFLKSDKKALLSYTVTLVNLKSGKLEEHYKSPSSKLENCWNYEYSNRVIQYGYSFYKKVKLTLDFNIRASDKVAIAFCGCSKKCKTEQGLAKVNDFFDGKIPFKKTYLYDKKNKKISVWKRIN